jgi:hypothetical protein
VVAAAVAQIPAPKDGQDASPEMVGVAVHEALAHALAALPKPVAIDDIRTLVTECMAEALSLLPVPQKGDKGDKGDDGESVRAEDFRPLFEAESARALLSFERRASDVLQRAIDRIDAGLIERALEQIDFSLVDDGDGNVTICFVRGEASKEFALRVPRFKDCGIYRDGGAHRAGDGVTHGGSFWISQKDGPQGAPGESSDWRLAVKKGRDGKDAPQPESIPAGPVRFK